MYDGRRNHSQSDADSIHTTLHGFANLLEAHSEKMSETHCKHYDLNEYS